MKKAEISNLISKAAPILMKLIGFILPEGFKFSYTLKFGGASFTDGSKINVGLFEFANDDFLEELQKQGVYLFPKDFAISYEEGFVMLKAVSLHEAAHILYSNFNVFKDFQKDIATDLEKDGIRREYGMKIAAQLLNCVEDGRIEKRLVNKFPGALKHLQFTHGTIWEIKGRKPESDLLALLDGIVTIATTGLYPKYFKDLSGTEVEKNLRAVRSLILDAINAPTAKSCAKKTYSIYLKIKELLLKLLEEEQKNAEAFEELMNSLSEIPDYTSSSELGSSEGPLGEGAKSVHLVPEDGCSGEGEGASKEGEGASKDGEGASKDGGTGVGDPSGADGISGKSSSSYEDIPYKEEDMDEYRGTIDRSSSSSKTSSTSGAPTKSIEESVKKIIDETKKEVVEEVKKTIEASTKTPEKTEKKETKLTEKEISEITADYSREYVKDFLEIERSFALMPLPESLRPQALKFRKEVEKFFKTQQRFDLPRMTSGKLDVGNLYRLKLDEYNVFIKRGHPSVTDAVVSICWDGSGSMYGAKQKYSGQACAIIEEGFKGFVPLKIINFTVNGSQVIHFLVKDFDENSSSVNYAYSYMHSKGFNGGNKDGFSIRICAQELLKRPERDKILLVLSDGQPTDYTYINPETDVKNAVKWARSKGIFVAAMFFGDEYFRQSSQQVYEYMYEKNLINSAPEELPSRLVKVLSKLVLR